jgi:hypothetical protein
MEKMPRRKGSQKMKSVSQFKDKWSIEETDRLRSWYYLDSEHNVVPWRDHFQTYKDYMDWWGSTQRQLFHDTVGPASVSTVFLGLDHDFGIAGKPVVFETLVFGGVHDGDMNRYCTYQDAKEGHEEMVKKQPSGLTRKQLEDGAELIRKLMK